MPSQTWLDDWTTTAMPSLFLKMLNWGTCGTLKWCHVVWGKSETQVCICETGKGGDRDEPLLFRVQPKPRRKRGGGGDQDGWVRKMRGQGGKQEQKQTQKLQSRHSNSIQSNVMIYHQHFQRTVALFSSSSTLSITTFSNIPVFFIYIPSVSQIFEAT